MGATILITADLHYDHRRSRQPTRDLAREICGRGGDVLVLAGDTAGPRAGAMRECLGLLADFGGRRLLVPGNHGLWCCDGESSMDRYERILPAVAADCGFAVLDHEPVVLGRVALVGSIGWYDYSFRDRSLGIPVGFYRAKVSPGAAQRTSVCADLLAAHRGRLTERHMSMLVRWTDGRRVRLGLSDEAFVDLLVDKLRRQLSAVSPRVDRIVAFMHHVPFVELIPLGRPDPLAFAAAYMGSGRLGEVLLEFPKVTDVYCGHSHWPCRARVGHINVVNVGSTYREKRLEVLNV